MSHPIEKTCPKCGAPAGQRCLGVRGERKAFHRERGARSPIVPACEIELDLTDTPIEHLLLSAIIDWLSHEASQAEVITQAAIGPYRADILLKDGGRSLVIEADGAAYHNSDEAIQRDKRRDRYCVIHGYAVMRFTGREIHSDPRGCAAEVGQWLRGPK
ncbi:endonuclease domain-containing protein [Qipengyuania pacifica]|uniref:endonuclease domain-containing protein n=1 Tax=Qipengyuania pacifica TaxID=2860199 RepID=UPI001C9D6FA0|nr:DUF559 domain-containing protein [Qipengyuania pacifica]MBY8333133.1 DUF559 domain-containing protein [Qipengyuania pacifica]